MSVTRLAPSPTGALHLGNARTFLVNWLLARQNGWRILLRIEDLDGPRVKRGADELAMEDLRWLGIDWDEGPVYQSRRQGVYDAAALDLMQRGMAYPCVCTRREIELAASAPHAEDGAAVYPGTCRGRFKSLNDVAGAAALRFDVSASPAVSFEDAFAGRKQYDVARELGDFVVRKADGTAAYQLAVVVDDLEAGVTQVVRGDDLLDSTPRQLLLYRALGRAGAAPRYCHLPLVVGPDGRRLAKRHGDTRLMRYRERGVSAGEVLALLASWCGMKGTQPRTAGDLLTQFQLEALPRMPIVYKDELE
jgi:glutamyl-tRNA synthetase